MKKLILSAIFLIGTIISKADEGMWLPLLLGDATYQEMMKKGLKLSKQQLFDLNKNSVKDAIIIFGGGCTGEIVSNKGLIFTNHHCGYGAIADASSVEKNYLRDGFYAKSLSEEIASKGLSVRFLNSITDVTAQILPFVKDLTMADRQKKINELITEITKKAVGDNKFKTATVGNFFKGNQFLLFTYDIFKDIRFVGTPPESIGKYGGDTDNWEWPRHTGDFSVFRVYANKNNQAADYNESNVPYKPKHFLSVSIKGVKENDFNMILGYPGSTNRFEVSNGIELAQDIDDPAFVKNRDIRLKLMKEEMDKSAANRLALASDYAGLANYWKFYDLEGKQLKQRNIAALKKKEEAMFQTWANGKPAYENLLSKYTENFNEWSPNAKLRNYMNQGINGIRLIQMASQLLPLYNELKNATPDLVKITKYATSLKSNVPLMKQNYLQVVDEKIMAHILQMFYNDIDKAQQPAGFFETLGGDLTNYDTYKNYAKSVFSNTMFFNDEKLNSFVTNPTLSDLEADSAFKAALAFSNNYNPYADKFTKFGQTNSDLGHKYLQGLFEMNKGKKVYYPDANQTMRLSYGKVAAYQPRDAVSYNYVTTLSGVLEKYQPGNDEFDLPAKLIELAKNKDYGRYADAKTKDIVVCFLNTCDITGGNSGSPVINGKGELVGLAFDGNAEAISHKLTFDAKLNRTICVDIRYVLWCIEKLGGAKNIIDELKLK